MKKRSNKILVRDIVENSRMIYEKLNNISEEAKSLQEQNDKEVEVLENNGLKESIDNKLATLVAESVKTKINEFLPSIVDAVAKEISDYVASSIDNAIILPLKENCDNAKKTIKLIAELSDTTEEDEVEEEVEEKEEEKEVEDDKEELDEEPQTLDDENTSPFDENGNFNGESAVEYDADTLWVDYEEPQEEPIVVEMEETVEAPVIEKQEVKEENIMEETPVEEQVEQVEEKDEEEPIVEEKVEETPETVETAEEMGINDISFDEVEGVEEPTIENQEVEETPSIEEKPIVVEEPETDEIMEDFFNSDVSLEEKGLSMEEEEEAIKRMNRDLEDEQDDKVYSDVDVPGGYVIDESDDVELEDYADGIALDTADIWLGETAIQQDIEINDENVKTNIKIKKHATLDADSFNTMPDGDVSVASVQNVLQPELKIESVNLNSDIHATWNIVGWGGFNDEMELVEETIPEDKDDEDEIEEMKKKKQGKRKIVNTGQNLETLTSQAISGGTDKEINLDDEIDVDLANFELETLQGVKS